MEWEKDRYGFGCVEDRPSKQITHRNAKMWCVHGWGVDDVLFLENKFSKGPRRRKRGMRSLNVCPVPKAVCTMNVMPPGKDLEGSRQNVLKHNSSESMVDKLKKESIRRRFISK